MVTIQLQPFIYRTWIWLSEIITGQEFGSEISLPDILLNTFDLSLVLNYTYTLCEVFYIGLFDGKSNAIVKWRKYISRIYEMVLS